MEAGSFYLHRYRVTVGWNTMAAMLATASLAGLSLYFNIEAKSLSVIRKTCDRSTKDIFRQFLTQRLVQWLCSWRVLVVCAEICAYSFFVMVGITNLLNLAVDECSMILRDRNLLSFSEYWQGLVTRAVPEIRFGYENLAGCRKLFGFPIFRNFMLNC